MRLYTDLKKYFDHAILDKKITFDDFHINKFKEFNHSLIGRYGKDIDIPHRRDFFALSITITGNITTKNVGNNSIPPKANRVIAISPYQIFSIKKPTQEAINSLNAVRNGFTVAFKNTFYPVASQTPELQTLFPFFKMHTASHYSLNNADLDEVRTVLEKMHKQSQCREAYSRELTQALLMQLLYLIKKAIVDKCEEAHQNRYYEITSQFEDCISKNRNDYFSIGEYAQRLNISPIYLSECVKNATGRTAKQIVNDYKIQHAQAELLQSNKPIAQISDEIGFAQVSTFIHFFKREVGMTPSAYRKHSKSNL
ncbi:hypothetical protein FUAX_29470 [Fulvitalea axinellae]|uniref:HTH araC/xylS-type domain-containing protein n=1 Tax=Fulvitalea axinellae TaxID=1182444 RepID=A0AAU9DDH7_9BACT|nr:hypothetical protein FUAX_29470 [Fulvitalea axinellae]